MLKKTVYSFCQSELGIHDSPTVSEVLKTGFTSLNLCGLSYQTIYLPFLFGYKKNKQKT